jgi:hypothetical protein
MDRRTFVVAGVLLGTAKLWGQTPSPPVASPPGAGAGTFPQTVELAPGLRLLTPRLGWAFGNIDLFALLFAELQSDLDTPQSPPTVLVTLLDARGDILAEEQASSPFPAILAKGRAPLRADFTDFGFHPLRDPWASVMFSLMGEWPGTGDVAPYLPAGLALADIKEEKEGAWSVEGFVVNESAAATEGFTVDAVFRDGQDRYAGYNWHVTESTLAPGQRARFTMRAGGLLSGIPAEPFQFIGGGDYRVDLFVWRGPRAPAVASGG